jgi:hypothetical protein
MLRILIGVTIVGCALCTVEGTDLVLTRLDFVHEENFDEFRGTFDSLPTGFAVSKNAKSLMGEGEQDFRRISAGNVSAGGCYAWDTSCGDYALGYQPTEDEFTPGYFLVVASNATGAAIRNLSVGYDVVFLNNADRSSGLDVELSLNGTNFSRIAEASFVSPQKRGERVSWGKSTRSLQVRFARLVLPGEKIWIRWWGEDKGGGGSRDEYGIDHIRITPRGPDGTVLSLK